MYRMQTTFLAHGKFCMPGLPLPDFFDSPYIFVRGIYAPVYFPGTALLHVCQAALLHLPYWPGDAATHCVGDASAPLFSSVSRVDR